MPLLIGGTNDGKRVNVPDGIRHWQMKCATREPFSPPVFNEASTKECFVKTEVYELRLLRGDDKTFEVFAIQGMTGDELMIELISKYRPAHSPCEP